MTENFNPSHNYPVKDTELNVLVRKLYNLFDWLKGVLSKVDVKSVGTKFEVGAINFLKDLRVISPDKYKLMMESIQKNRQDAIQAKENAERAQQEAQDEQDFANAMDGDGALGNPNSLIPELVRRLQEQNAANKDINEVTLGNIGKQHPRNKQIQKAQNMINKSKNKEHDDESVTGLWEDQDRDDR